jgi:hypothetical protein
MSDAQSKTTAYEMGDEEVGALHCLGMCADWAGHPACDGEHGLRQFLIDCAEGLRWQRDEIGRLRAEVASLRLTLGGRRFGPDVPEPIGCPAPGACVQVAEITRLRRGWLRVIQMENSCPATGGGCLAKRCGCVAEMEMLAGEADKIA